MRILFITHCFPPLAVTASHRPYGWARAWADAGHDVHVVTPEKYAFDGEYDLDLSRDGITVHEARYAGRFLARRVATATAAATATLADGAATHRGSRWSGLKRATRRLRSAIGDVGDPRLWAVPALIDTATAAIRDAPFDLLVSTYGPASAHIAASRIATRTGLPWVADYQDLWSRPYGTRRRSRLREELDARCERRLMRHAAMIVTLSHGLADRLRGLHGRDCEVAYFGYDDYTPVSPIPPTDAGARLHIVYTGRVYPAHQPLEMFFAAVGDAVVAHPAIARSIAIDFYGPEQQDLRRLCARYRTEVITHFHGLVPHARALGLQRGAGAALWFDWADAGTPGVLTYKVFEYLHSGAPIVAINAGFPTEASRLIDANAAGVVLSSRDEITRFLLALPDSLPARPPIGESVEQLSNRRQGLAIMETIERKLFTRNR